MELNAVFSSLAFVLSMSAFVPYITGILRGKIETTASAWIAWTLLNAAILASMIAGGDIAWQIPAFVLGNAGIALTSIIKGGYQTLQTWTKLDYVCLTGVVIGIALWIISNNPEVVVVISIAAMFVGFVPMLRNIWREPERESIIPWIIFACGGFFGVLAIKNWDIVGALTPLYYFIVQLILVFLISRKHWR